MSPIVSIIMPAYNAAQYLSDSIESVIAQTYTNWELLIVDDGSTDNTAAIAQSFCKTDSRVKYYFQQNGRQGKARNLALSHSIGQYIAFLDADDLWMPEKLETQLKQLHEKQVELVFSECKVFEHSLADSAQLLNIDYGMFSGESALKFFMEQNKIPVLSVLLRADVLRAAGGFAEKSGIQNAEDYHLWLRLLLNGHTFYGSELVLAAYRVHLQGATTTDRLAMPNVIEAFSDLIHTYPQQRKLIQSYLKKWFKKYHYFLSNPAPDFYKKLIEKNCIYTGHSFYQSFFSVAYKLFGFRIARKLVNKIINE